MKDIDVTIMAENRNRPRFNVMRFGFLGTALLLFLVVWAIWSWGFCRFYVPPGKMAVIIAKSGKELHPGQILAQSGQRGILEDVLGEGRHIWNPYFYDWEIHDAQYIPPGKMGVVTSLVGDNLSPGEFLADPGQKGIWRKVLGPGRYRLNPYGYSVDIIDAVSIPVGFAGVVTNLSDEPAETELTEASDSEANRKGVRADVLQPGIYYINPHAYKVIAVEVGVNQVALVGQAGSVIMTKSIMQDANNQMIQRLNSNFLNEQRRQRKEQQQQILSSAQTRQSDAGGMLEELVNDPGAAARHLISKNISQVGSSMVLEGSMPVMEKDVSPAYILNQFVKFPSRDGFDISLDMTVEFELRPEHLAMIYRTYGDMPSVVQKILIPQIQSVASLKGSKYRAVDYIAGEGREIFQNDITDALKNPFGDRKILVHSALIRNVNVPDQILEPLRVASLSKETNLTNKEKQNMAKKQAELNREMSLIRQAGEQVVQETQKLKAQIRAEGEKAAGMILADTSRQVAAMDKQTATVLAQRTVALGKADADAVQMVEEEKAKGFGMKVQAFSKDANEYALYEFATALNPTMKVTILHAGEGTLWTDLKTPTFADFAGAKQLKAGAKK